jgi:CDP-glucose 4,6-dehydratase
VAHFLITGHTGFKGYWLSVLLRSRGHSVSGLSLSAQPDSLYSRSTQKGDFVHDLVVDIRDRNRLIRSLRRVAPDYVVHMAAQSLVRRGYKEPNFTYETNVVGTLNVLAAIDETESVRAAVIVTSDKVYQNVGAKRWFLEDDPLGGVDPYSASKAMADILSQEYSARLSSKPIGIARAGNVIGAGDMTEDRLFPDLIRSARANTSIRLRYPDAVRPWQHVLDCLQGYLFLIEFVEAHGSSAPYNFGPPPATVASVRNVVELAFQLLGRDPELVEYETPTLHEDSVLLVDAARARLELGWQDRFTLEQSVEDALFDALNTDGLPIGEHIDLAIGDWERAQGKL